MAEPECRSHLWDEVYPNLDASELLSSLRPRKSGGEAYILECPSCGKANKAYYYPGSPYIICNRKNDCGEMVTIWDAVQKEMGISGSEVFKLLCSHSGVGLPAADTAENLSKKKASVSLRDGYISVTQSLLYQSDEAMAYLQNERGLSAEQIKNTGLGYYPSDGVVEAALKASGVDTQAATASGLLRPETSEGRPLDFSKRIIGYWGQPEGDIRIWGRSIAGAEPKYLFTSRLKKTVPYGYRRSKWPVVAVEGTLDKHSLDLCGVPASATGGAQVSRGQAQFLYEQGETELVYLTDGDNAGRAGILGTIKLCEPLGIQTFFGVLRDGQDDVDDLRKKGETEKVQNLVRDAICAGAYLANMVLSEIELSGPTYRSDYRMYFEYRNFLTAQSRMVFDRTLARYSIEVQSKKAEALRHVVSMQEMGYDPDLIRKVIKDRYSMSFEMTELEASNG